MKKLYSTLLLLALPLLVLLYYKYNPVLYSFFPKCPFFVLTGLDCPGCGSQRAVHALLHGDLIKAADHNLLLVFSLPLLLTHYCYKMVSTFKGREVKWKILDQPKTPVVIFLIVLIFWIARNLPFAAFSFLAA